MEIYKFWTLVGMLAGGFGWLIYQIHKTNDRMDNKFDKMNNKFDDLRKDVQSLDSRISRIEGQLMGPVRWVPEVVERKEEK